MKCDHVRCTGKHGFGVPVAERCPAATERKRALDRAHKKTWYQKNREKAARNLDQYWTHRKKRLVAAEEQRAIAKAEAFKATGKPPHMTSRDL